ncbi:MAG TPA: DUF4139 domain-containing protein [Anaerohalosphaeraceae bacterium]|nr:DUF4139 domain-containing protein [Anaerohalosphaeraceae bacterium]
MKRFIHILLAAAATGGAWAKVDLSTLPERETVQLTIYNSADLTLVRESRPLTVKEGANSLQFSWENTLIDPTSLEMVPKAHAGQIDISELVYPARVRNLGLWKVQSEVSGKVPVEITYLTSGLSWRAFYMGTLRPDEKAMRLEGYVVVTNNSGEDYENAQTRLIVGKVHILDQIAELARRQYPYGSPQDRQVFRDERSETLGRELKVYFGQAVMAGAPASKGKEIVKEGLSEYFLYTIEGTETIATGWSKRLPSFAADAVPVVNLYKYEEERYGGQVIRFLSFANDAEHKLGDTPIPGGVLKVYRDVGEAGHLSYEGQSAFKYIPVGEDVELNLGAAADVVVEPKLMEVATENYRFDNKGSVSGWDDVQRWRIEVRNTRDVAVKVEIRRNFPTSYWKLDNEGQVGVYEVEDMDTVKYTLELEPQTKQTFEYVLRMYQGTRAEDWRK